MRWAQRDAASPSRAIRISPNSVPTRAVLVRALKPWAAYSTTNMIAEDPISATMTGFDPATRAGNMNLTRMNPANASPISEANPRHRATATTATAKITVSTINGVRRSKSANWYWAGWSSIARHPGQLDHLADLDAGGVDGLGQRHGDGQSLVVALEQLRDRLGAVQLADVRGRAGQPVAGDLLDLGDPRRGVGDARDVVAAGQVGVDPVRDVARPEDDQADHRPDGQRDENDDQDAQGPPMPAQLVRVDHRWCAHRAGRSGSDM